MKISYKDSIVEKLIEEEHEYVSKLASKLIKEWHGEKGDQLLTTMQQLQFKSKKELMLIYKMRKDIIAMDHELIEENRFNETIWTKEEYLFIAYTELVASVYDLLNK